MTHEELAGHRVLQEAAALVNSQRGFRMPAWNILHKLQQTEGYSVLVGPSVFEAAPTFDWSTSEEDFLWDQGAFPIVFLGVIPPHRHEDVLRRLAACASGLILTRSEDLSEAAYSHLNETLGRERFITEDDAATYEPNWWHTGNKKLSASKEQVIYAYRLKDVPSYSLPLP